MEKLSDLAIVLKVIPFEERNQIVTALTENHGLVVVMAKNSIHSRRFAAALDLFTAAQWSFERKPGREIDTLIEAETKESFMHLRGDFQKLSAGSMMSEILQRTLQRGHAVTDLFKLLSNALFALDHCQRERTLGIANTFLLKILQWAGHQPLILSCHECHKGFEHVLDQKVYGLSELAAWVCQDCRQAGGIEFLGAGLLDLKVMQNFPIRKASELLVENEDGQRALFRFLHELVIYHVPGLDRTPLKSMVFLSEVLNVESRA